MPEKYIDKEALKSYFREISDNLRLSMPINPSMKYLYSSKEIEESHKAFEEAMKVYDEAVALLTQLTKAEEMFGISEKDLYERLKKKYGRSK